VLNTLDNTTNLAAMDWQDFEHLIRELFEKEFFGARSRGQNHTGQ
jgi:restriction system protein